MNNNNNNKMTDTFKGDSHEAEPVILERKVKTALKVLERNKLPEINGISME